MDRTTATPIDTERLRLRQWQDADLEPFAALNADPAVMAHFASPLTREQSDAFVQRARARIDAHGWGFWALELRADGGFVGAAGLVPAPATMPFAPCVEVGWRLAQRFWGRGLAAEAGRAALGFGFERLGLERIVSFTALDNRRSRAVMERLGMRQDDADAIFDHPGLPVGHRLRAHCLYRLSGAQWAARRVAATAAADDDGGSCLE